MKLKKINSKGTVVVITFVASLIIGLSTFTDAVKNLTTTVIDLYNNTFSKNHNYNETFLNDYDVETPFYALFNITWKGDEPMKIHISSKSVMDQQGQVYENENIEFFIVDPEYKRSVNYDLITNAKSIGSGDFSFLAQNNTLLTAKIKNPTSPFGYIFFFSAEGDKYVTNYYYLSNLTRSGDYAFIVDNNIYDLEFTKLYSQKFPLVKTATAIYDNDNIDIRYSLESPFKMATAFKMNKVPDTFSDTSALTNIQFRIHNENNNLIKYSFQTLNLPANTTSTFRERILNIPNASHIFITAEIIDQQLSSPVQHTYKINL